MTLEEVLVFVLRRLHDQNIPYMLTGAVAVNYYGRPRLTHDIDLVVEVREKQIPALVTAFAQDFYASQEGITDAIVHRSSFNFIHHASGLKIDFWLVQGTPFDEERFARRQQVVLFDERVWVTTAEDLILIKLLWLKESGSQKHRDDIQGIVAVQKDRLSNQYVERWTVQQSTRALWGDVIAHLES